MSSDISQYKCPNCGAAIPFDPQAGQLKCPHCDTLIDINSLDEMEDDNNQEEHLSWDTYKEETIENIEGQTSYVCPSCGGEVIGDSTMSACQCPYCGNSVIVEDKFKGLLKPDLVIPFTYTKNEAKEVYYNYLKGKKLLAKDFSANNVIEKINGLYVPYWLFGCDAKVKARYNATRVRNYRQGDYDVEEIDHYVVIRDGEMSFSNVPVDASIKLPDALMESLEPFDYKKAVDFNTAYLSGFFSNRYDVDVEEAIVRANQRIRLTASSAVRSTVHGYSSVFETRNNINFDNGKVRYGLLPIYIFSTKYNGEVYHFAMNGQTGKFSGNLPADKGRVVGYSFLIFAICFAIIFGLLMVLVK